MKIIYKAEDGTEFDNKNLCVAYEKSCAPEYQIEHLVRVKTITNTYSKGEYEEISKIIIDNFNEIKLILEKEKTYTLYELSKLLEEFLENHPKDYQDEWVGKVSVLEYDGALSFLNYIKARK